jgi:cytidylate kinase
MPVITVSKCTFSKEREVSEKLAEKLGYECIDKQILFEASEYFKIPEIELSRALHESPFFFNCFEYGKQRNLSYISYILLKCVQKDNMVYHGFAGHLFLKDVPHVLKVKIVSSTEDRLAEVMKRETLSEQKARQMLRREDGKRRKWCLRQFGVDNTDMIAYDLVLHLDKITIDAAVNIIAETSQRPCFQNTSQSQEILSDLLNSAKIQTILIEKFPKVGVTSKRGKVHINHKGVFGQEEYMKKQIAAFLQKLPGFKNIDVDISVVMDIK